MWHSLIFSGKIVIILIYQSLSLIIGTPLRGHNIVPVDIPFIASLSKTLPNGRIHFCTGSLITNKLVLTASHCLDDVKYNEVDVVIGAANLKDAQPQYAVNSWITFKTWAEKKNLRMIRPKKNDIAIVKLETQVEQPGVTPANITTLKIEELYGKNATIIGWTAEQDSTIRTVLKKANVQILTMSDCKERFQLITNRIADIPLGLFCTAANPFTVVTHGDSGGPLLDEHNNILAINRSICPRNLYNCTEEFADQNRFNVHTNFLREYRQFIDDIKRRF